MNDELIIVHSESTAIDVNLKFTMSVCFQKKKNIMMKPYYGGTAFFNSRLDTLFKSCKSLAKYL